MRKCYKHRARLFTGAPVEMNTSEYSSLTLNIFLQSMFYMKKKDKCFLIDDIGITRYYVVRSHIKYILLTI